jgi:hypothetical protein
MRMEPAGVSGGKDSAGLGGKTLRATPRKDVRPHFMPLEADWQTAEFGAFTRFPTIAPRRVFNGRLQ